MNGIIDFHNHVTPAVDDGAQTAEESASAITAMRDHGVTGIVATPHFDASLTLKSGTAAARLSELDAGWERLTSVASAFPDVTLHRGVEVMLDAPQPDLSDPRLHLGGGRFVLVEFPYMTVPPESARAIAYLRAGGLTPIIAHPERYNGVTVGSSLPVEWKAAGALLQLNGPSLLGKYGKGARAHGLDLLRRGLVDYICSDYHTRGSPQIMDYRSWLEEQGAGELAHTLMVSNPARMLRGEEPLPVMPLRPVSRGWSRLLPWKR